MIFEIVPLHSVVHTSFTSMEFVANNMLRLCIGVAITLVSEADVPAISKSSSLLVFLENRVMPFKLVFMPQTFINANITTFFVVTLSN